VSHSGNAHHIARPGLPKRVDRRTRTGRYVDPRRSSVRPTRLISLRPADVKAPALAMLARSTGLRVARWRGQPRPKTAEA